ncbi:glycosyltransferase family 1 protein [candidate division KSB1 bacterium]|nr:MAG: glycosyltransferase family 1 protein [candidate division KSB1 bacterium]
MRKIKVLNIQSRICIGGPAIQIELVAKYLDRSRFDMCFLGGSIEKGETSRFHDIQKTGVKIDLIETMQRRSHPLNDLLSVWHVYWYIRKEKPDIVHTHTAKAGAVGRLAAFFARTPVILHTFHGHSFENYFSRPLTTFFILLERILARISTRIIAISELQKADLTEKYKIARPDRVALVKIGLELGPYLARGKTNDLKQSLGLADDAILVGTVGRLVPIKNFAMALRVMAKIRISNPRVHLCIAGDGPERGRLAELAKELDLHQAVHMPGWIFNMPSFYAGIDIFMLTSLNEGTPVSILEAMASRCPVVATAVGGVPDLIKDKVNGYCCASNDVTAMSNHINSIIKNQKMASDLCEAARQFVIQEYSKEKFISEIEDLYHGLVCEKVDAK